MKRDRSDDNLNLEQNGSFDELGLSERVLKSLGKVGKYVHPTKVQQQVIPVFLKGHDVLVRSETGSGKTLSYLLPLLDCLQKEKIARTDGTFVIIIAPTRELVVQIVEETQVSIIIFVDFLFFLFFFCL